MATATDDNAEIRNLDVRLFKKSTCWYTSVYNKLFAIPKDILEELPHKNCQRQFQKNNTNIYNVKYKRPGKYPGPNIIQLILVLSQII